MKEELTKRICKLLCVKSLVTISLTGCMVALLLGAFNPPDEISALFCTSYGSIMTFFFTRKDVAE